MTLSIVGWAVGLLQLKAVACEGKWGQWPISVTHGVKSQLLSCGFEIRFCAEF